jgi:hypothetical protein
MKTVRRAKKNTLAEKGGKMKRRLFVSLGLLMLSGGALFPWGSVTHLYIDEQLVNRNGGLMLNACYGSMAPDAVNYLFSSPYLEDLYVATHYQFAPMWDEARSRVELSLAFGFISHNDAWGADYTAHHSGITYGAADGYVIAKARELLAMAPLPPELPLSDAQAMTLYHEFVETAINVLMKRIDPQIGVKVIESAMKRSRQFPVLMARAYSQYFASFFGGEIEAEKAIFAMEGEFRKIMILLGQALCQDEATAVQLLAGQMADMAEDFLGGPLPIPREEAAALIGQLIGAAMQLCGADCLQEIQATVSQLELQMAAYGYALSGSKNQYEENAAHVEK